MRRPDSRAAWARLSTVLMPLVDLVMLLVLFFALAQGVIQNPLVPVELPEAIKARDGERPGGDPVVTVDASGRVFLDGAPTEINALAASLQSGRRVRVRADQVTPYKRVRGVLDALRDQGITNVRLAVAPAGSANAAEAGGRAR